MTKVKRLIFDSDIRLYIPKEPILRAGQTLWKTERKTTQRLKPACSPKCIFPHLGLVPVRSGTLEWNLNSHECTDVTIWISVLKGLPVESIVSGPQHYLEMVETLTSRDLVQGPQTFLFLSPPCFHY